MLYVTGDIHADIRRLKGRAAKQLQNFDPMVFGKGNQIHLLWSLESGTFDYGKLSCRSASRMSKT